jgi:tRNA(Ile)-lysidine synthase
MNLPEKVKKAIEQQNLICRADKILIGVSGGADSVALASILQSLRATLGVQLVIAHFNHKLRASADADQRFVEGLAKRFNVPFISAGWTGKRSSSEESSREKRFAFFIRAAMKTNADSVALAHTMNDQAETVLMRILRGSGLQGIGAIRPKNKMHGMTFIRPLLGFQRQEIETYLRGQKLRFRIDPTNLKPFFYRNKIRLDLLPYIAKKYNPNIHGSLVNLADISSTDFDYLEQAAVKIFKQLVRIDFKKRCVSFAVSGFNRQHLSMKRMLIRMAYAEIKGDMNQLTLAHLREVDDLLEKRLRGAIVHFPAGVSVFQDQKRIFIKASDR